MSKFPLPRVDWPATDPPEADDEVDDHVAPVVPWSTFMQRMDWRQGEHVTLVGATGGGKTTTAIQLLPMRDWVVTFATKPADDTLDQLVASGYKRVPTWPPGPPLDDQPAAPLDDAAPDQPGHWFWSAGVDDRAPELVEVDDRLAPRVVLWPEMRRLRDLAEQRAVFYDAIDDIFAAGGWTIFADELYYLAASDFVDLGDELKILWQQGRSIGISLVAATQRPAWVPLEAYSQATHVLFWRMSDRRDLDRISGLGAHDPVVIRETVSQLRRYELLYLNTRTGDLMRTTPPAPDQKG